MLDQINLEPQVRLAQEPRLGLQQTPELGQIAFIHRAMHDECMPKANAGALGSSGSDAVLAQVLEEYGSVTPMVDPASEFRMEGDGAVQQECGYRLLLECAGRQECIADDVSLVARTAGTGTQFPLRVKHA